MSSSDPAAGAGAGSGAAASPAPSSSGGGAAKASSGGGAPAAAPRSDKFVSKRAYCDGGEAQNKIIIGHGSVVHPEAQLLATNGPIYVGEYCIVDEYALIENCSTVSPGAAAEGGGGGGGSSGPPANALVIGDFSYFGSRCHVQARRVGQCCRLMPFSSAGIMAVVEDGCVVHPHCRVTHDALLERGSVVHSNPPVVQVQQEPLDLAAEAEAMKSLTRYYRKYLR